MKRWFQFAAALTLALLVATGAAAQYERSIRGQVKDFQGKPLPGATVVVKNEKTGRTWEAKTDEKGNFAVASLQPGVYLVILRAQVQGEAEEREVYQKPYQLLPSEDLFVDMDLQKLMAEQQEQLAEQAEAMQKFEAMKQSYDAGVAALNQAKQSYSQLIRAPRDERAPLQQQFSQQATAAITNLEAARTTAEEAGDENRHLVLAKLGEAYEVARRYDDSVASYQKAIELVPENVSPTDLAGYYNNLGNALGKAGKIEEASKAYEKSAELNPAGAAQAYLNFGIVLYNANQLTGAVEPLKKAVELNPNHAEAWYLLGASLLASMETRTEGGKEVTVLQPGTLDAYKKYLELAPNGRFAEEVKGVLQSLESMNAKEAPRKSG